MMSSYIQLSLIVFFVLLIIFIMVAFIDNHHFRDFINGFWKTEGGENNIILYFDTEQEKANVIISRNGITLSEKKYIVRISDMGAFSNIMDMIFRPKSMKFNVQFEVDEDTEETDDYDELFLDKEFVMQVTIDKGVCTLYADDIDMFLIKDNVTNYKFLEYLLQ